MVTRVLAERSGLAVAATTRGESPGVPTAVSWQRFDAARDSLDALLDATQPTWIVNAIAVTAPLIEEGVNTSVLRAIEVNAVFPRRLAQAAAARRQRVIQIATDGVYSGLRGPYDESAPHDAQDVYGRTKSLGEVVDAHIALLRCSIVGPEAGSPRSLLGWLLALSPGATVRGFTGQRWNGVTTLHFAKLCAAVIEGAEVPAVQHIVPGDSLSKAELLELAARAWGRQDLRMRRELGPHRRDRTLSTLRPDANRGLWQAAGYGEPPTIAAMLEELAALE
jgi:dTDP-4-dehydrorhamnose reductase